MTIIAKTTAIMAISLLSISVASVAHAQTRDGKVQAKPTTPARQSANKPAQPLSRAQFLNGRSADFGRMDANSDKVLSELEIVTYRVKAAETEALARNKAAFAALDTDRNGSISPAEFAAIVKPVPLPDIKPMIASMDADRNNAISAPEYLNGMATQFDRMDRNRNGVIDQAELNQPTTPRPPVSSR